LKRFYKATVNIEADDNFDEDEIFDLLQDISLAKGARIKNAEWVEPSEEEEDEDDDDADASSGS
jgi:hypothetical protein